MNLKNYNCIHSENTQVSAMVDGMYMIYMGRDILTVNTVT